MGICVAARLKKKRLGDKNISSPYHAADRSKRESPVLNGAPRLESLAGYRVWISFGTSGVMVELSMKR